MFGDVWLVVYVLIVFVDFVMLCSYLVMCVLDYMVFLVFVGVDYWLVIVNGKFDCNVLLKLF